MFVVLAFFTGNAFAEVELPIRPEMVEGKTPEEFQQEVQEYFKKLKELDDAGLLGKKAGFNPISGGFKTFSLAQNMYDKYKALPKKIKLDLDRVKDAVGKSDKIIASAPLLVHVTTLLDDFEDILNLVKMNFIPNAQKKIRPVLAKLIEQSSEIGEIIKSLSRMIPKAITPVTYTQEEVDVIKDLVIERMLGN